MDLKKELQKLLKPYVQVEEHTIEVPPNPELGDYAVPCFHFAKQFKKAPNLIAEELAKKIKLVQPFSKIEIKGAYLNFFVDKGELAKRVLKEIITKKDKYGKGTAKGTVMLEYPSPNTNKPLHLGHIRNMLIGSSVSNILTTNGMKVIRANLNNDRGVHICKSMLAYQRWGKLAEPDIKSDHFVGKFYVLYNENVNEHPELEQEIQEMLRRWEEGDKKVRALWKLLNSWAHTGFEETYAKLGISFDTYYYESDFYDKGKEIVLQGLKKGIFKKDDKGNICAELEQYGMPNKIVLRADGTSVYITQDLYLAQLKFKDYKLDQSIHVVGSEQNAHFQQLFKVLELLGYVWAKKCHHLSYGMVYLPEGKMKSREGTVVDADDLIANVINLAKVEVRKRYTDLSKEEVEHRAQIIGLGALKFYMLKLDHHHDIHYDPKESLSFEGETGPYVQYAHARICSVLKKHGGKVDVKADLSVLTDDHEKRLILLLGNFPHKVGEAAEHHRPSTMARYLLDLAQAFNEFYHACPILTEKEDLKQARLVLITCIKMVIHKGMHLLGIESPEVM